MSYGVMAYLLDTNELLSIVGKSKKRGFFNISKQKNGVKDRILNNFASDFYDLDEGIEEALEDGGEFERPSSSRQILDEFLSNNIKNSSYSFVYGYVFKILCEYLGAFLDNSNWYPCASENYYAIPFTSYNIPIVFPIPDDFPAMYYIDHRNIDLEKAEYKDIDEEQKIQLIDWFNQALKAKKDLYLFYH